MIFNRENAYLPKISDVYKTTVPQLGTDLIILSQSTRVIVKINSKHTLRIGREDINVTTAMRSFGKTNCPFGLFISEQT